MLDGVFEFANVSRPLVIEEHSHGLRAEILDILSLFNGEPLQETSCEKRNVVDALSQSGQQYGNHVQSVVEVLAKIPFLDFVDQVFVRAARILT